MIDANDQVEARTLLNSTPAATAQEETPQEQVADAPVSTDRRTWVGKPSFQAGYTAGMEHEAFITRVIPKNLRSLCPFANEAAIDRWEFGFITAVS